MTTVLDSVLNSTGTDGGTYTGKAPALGAFQASPLTQALLLRASQDALAGGFASGSEATDRASLQQYLQGLEGANRSQMALAMLKSRSDIARTALAQMANLSKAGIASPFFGLIPGASDTTGQMATADTLGLGQRGTEVFKTAGEGSAAFTRGGYENLRPNDLAKYVNQVGGPRYTSSRLNPDLVKKGSGSSDGPQVTYTIPFPTGAPASPGSPALPPGSQKQIKFKGAQAQQAVQGPTTQIITIDRNVLAQRIRQAPQHGMKVDQLGNGRVKFTTSDGREVTYQAK